MIITEKLSKQIKLLSIQCSWFKSNAIRQLILNYWAKT